MKLFGSFANKLMKPVEIFKPALKNFRHIFNNFRVFSKIITDLKKQKNKKKLR